MLKLCKLDYVLLGARRNFRSAWGLFLESPENFSGLEKPLNCQIQLF